MKKAVYSDRSTVVEILTKSFNANKSVIYAVGKREKRIERLMRYSFNICFSFGEIYLSDDNDACILFLDPERKKTNMRTLLWDVELAVGAIGLPNLKRVMQRENLIKQCHPKHSMRYLWFIGVRPDRQGKGVGSLLLNQALQISSLPVYLETSTVKNLAWYQKFGFHIYREIALSYKLYLLKKYL